MSAGRGMRARAFDRWGRDEVGVSVQLEVVGGEARYVDWDQPHRGVVSVPVESQAPENATLRLPADVARAVYEALAEHFGHSAGDVGLRKTLEVERTRVDKLIDYAMESKVQLR